MNAQQHISSNISDPDLIRDLGLIGSFQLIDIAAQQEGHPAGDAILTEPNSALGATDYSYYIQLVGQQLEVAIPCKHYEAYEEVKHELGVALPRHTEEFLQMVFDEIEAFFCKVKSLLVSKPQSPTLAALKLSKGTNEIPVSDEPSVKAANILHYSDLLNASTKQKPVPIDQAEFLYQPVHGTNPNNTYYIVCLTTTGIRMAAKYHDNALRVRFVSTWYNSDTEGAIKDLCEDFNFTKKTGGHYSVTFLDLNPKIAQKTLYAMLATFDPLQIRTGLPLIEEFKGV